MQLIEPGVAMFDPASGDQRHAGSRGAAHRRAGGVRLFRRAAGPGRRRAGAGRRFHRQRAGRAGHRRQDRGAADHRIRRPRHAAGARRRDQAAQAPRDADQPGDGRADPHLASKLVTLVRDVRAARRRSTRSACRARRRAARRLPQGDGVHHAHAPRRRDLRRRRATPSSPTRPSSAPARLAQPQRRAPTATAAVAERRRRRRAPPAGRRAADAPAPQRARRGARGRRGARPRASTPPTITTVATLEPSSTPGSRAPIEAGVVAFDTETDLARPDPRRSRRRLARDRAGRGLLHPARPLCQGDGGLFGDGARLARPARRGRWCSRG